MKNRRSFLGFCLDCGEVLDHKNSSEYSRRTGLCLSCRRYLAILEGNYLCGGCSSVVTSRINDEEILWSARNVSLCETCFFTLYINYSNGVNTPYDDEFEKFNSRGDLGIDEDEDNEGFTFW